MDNESPALAIDAVPHRLPLKINENRCNKNISLESLLNEFSVEDYKSILFLLMDSVGLNEFLTLTKKEKSILKQTFIQLYLTHFNDDKILVELFGTLKLYKRLRLLNTCSHLYKNQEETFNQIHGIWKMLYSLCEELIDDDVEILKQNVPSDFRDQILSAEDWFCWALQNEIFCRTDLSNLEIIFNHYPDCLNIIKNYKDKPRFESYCIRTPSVFSYCGIALIINFDTFDEHSGLERRENSDVDVCSLEKLWKSFGFKTDVFINLTSSDTLKKLKFYSTEDHSNYDAFVCCILSHGNSDAIYCSDGEMISIPELIATVVNNCVSLNEKPKLFFIQACQGTNIHQGVGKPIYQVKTASTTTTKSSNSSVPPILCDVLLAPSTINGYVSFRGTKGSWFIQSLCDLMNQYGDKYSIEEIMTKVNEKVRTLSADFGPTGPREALQIVPYTSTLGKKLILKKQIRGKN